MGKLFEGQAEAEGFASHPTKEDDESPQCELVAPHYIVRATGTFTPPQGQEQGEVVPTEQSE
jgi:hypothetical protein